MSPMADVNLFQMYELPSTVCHFAYAENASPGTERRCHIYTIYYIYIYTIYTINIYYIYYIYYVYYMYYIYYI